MCFCVSRIFCVCLLVGLLKCGCCASKHTEKFNSINITDELIFLKHIFSKYGTNGSMNFDGFQQLLHNVGLVKVFSTIDIGHNHDHDDHGHDHSHDEHHQDSFKSTENGISPQTLPHESHDHEDKSSKIDYESRNKEIIHLLSELTMDELNETALLKLTSSKKKCLSATETLYNFKVSVQGTPLSSTDFLQLCPAIIFDLDRNHCFFHKDDPDPHSDVYEQPGGEVWLFAIGAVIIISLCGLCSVAMVPLLQRVFYQSVLQFLVGLAIGSLSGDSLLHLLPHAMAGLNHHDHQGSSSHGDGHGEHADTESHMWRGLVALTGIYAFYLAERLLTRVSSCYRKTSDRKESLPRSVGSRKSDKVPRKAQSIHKLDPEQSKTVGEKLSHHKHGSYGFSFDQLEMEDLQKLNEMTKEDSNIKAEFRSASDSDILTERDSEFHDELQQSKAFSTSLTSKSMKLDDSGANETLVVKTNGKERNFAAGTHGGSASAGGSGSSLHFHHAHHHHHHHHHTHLTSPGSGNGTISSVAYMVIMGDGLHNFCDGLAIGAAFATGLSSGISTTIAVFCHELPHELGDFAMLIKAGMSVKQALIYNGLSSILCFVGMMVGVLLGNVGSATLWVFAGAAGMFLYIALVDMLPELTTQEDTEGGGLKHLFLQALGITCGISIMLVIAIYEHDLRHLIS